MSKDKYRKLPATLQSELTEYSSLLRALRASDTLDIAANLHKPPPLRPSRSRRQRPSQESSDYDVDARESHDGDEKLIFLGTEDHPPPTSPFPSLSEPGSSTAQRNTGKKRKRSPSIQTRKRKRDNWTRWPLRSGDVPKPEWSFEEEIAAIVSRVMKESQMNSSRILVPELEDTDDAKDDVDGEDAERASQASGIDDEHLTDEDEEEDEEYISSLVPYLTEATKHLLSATLILISKHTPPRPRSMQNRIEPIDWRGFLNILSSYNDRSYVDEGLLQTVTARLQSIYADQDPDEPTEEILAAKRVALVDTARGKLKQALKAADDDLFEFTEPRPLPPHSEKATRRKSKGKEKAEMVEEPDPSQTRKVVRKLRRRVAKSNTAGPSTVQESPPSSPSF